MRIFALPALLVLCISSFAQPRLNHVVRGEVKDVRTGKPVISANVTVPGRNYATVTNDDGVFVLKSDVPIRELIFTHLGYRTLRQTVEEGNMNVKMMPESYRIAGAGIISGNPYEIVLAAIRKIPDNYAAAPELLNIFYRETLQKRQRYTYVSEAVARVYKTAYSDITIVPDRTAVDKSRVIVSQRKRDTLSVKMTGGPTMAVTFDAVKNDNVLFNATDLPLYTFELDNPAYIGDRLNFVIHLIPSGEAEYALFHGTLYIDQETLLFSRIELSLDMSDIRKATQMMLVKKPVGLRFYPKEMAFTMTYRPAENGARLEYFRSAMRFNCDWKKRLLKTQYAVVNELVVTDVASEAVRIPRNDVFHAGDALSDRAGEFYDPDFWKDYNIIEPSESLENAINKLKK
ncbi:MAG: carboxypeptidase-like regulatory domain-containing protein [Bacteroidales bacterium]|nr:carboxypeptidase-like regulatory domain-containing protein [Bacteroidales bacterium]